MDIRTDLNLFVSNIPNTITPNRLKRILFHHIQGYFNFEKSASKSKAGNVFSIRLKLSSQIDKDYLLGLSLLLEGFQITISEFMSKSQRLRKDASILGRKFYLGNLPPHSSKDQLSQDLESVGKVEEFYAKYSNQGHFLYAFVTFKNKLTAIRFRREGLALLPPQWKNISLNIYDPKRVLAISKEHKIQNRRQFLDQSSFNRATTQRKLRLESKIFESQDQTQTQNFRHPPIYNSPNAYLRNAEERREFDLEEIIISRQQSQIGEVWGFNSRYEVVESPISDQNFQQYYQRGAERVFSFTANSNKNIRDVVRFGLNHHLDNLRFRQNISAVIECPIKQR